MWNNDPNADIRYVDELSLGKDNKSWKTFVMSVPDPNAVSNYSSQRSSISIRPSNASYKNWKSGKGMYTLYETLMEFRPDLSISQALILAALYGINVDFIEICQTDNNYNTRILKRIDLHVDDAITEEEKAKFPRYYVAKNKLEDKPFDWLLIDRYAFSGIDVDFMHGEYDKSGIIAGFAERKMAIELCKRMNNCKLTYLMK